MINDELLLMGTPIITNEMIEKLQREGKYKSGIATPQFPGQQKGFSIQAIQTLIKKQKRSRGFNFNLASGSQPNNIELSGTARIFLGFSLLLQPDVIFADRITGVTFTVNNEIVIQDVDPEFFSPEFMDDEYYFFPRPLSGSDTLNLQTEALADQALRMIAYYI